jgi:hypothetical protein
VEQQLRQLQRAVEQQQQLRQSCFALAGQPGAPARRGQLPESTTFPTRSNHHSAVSAQSGTLPGSDEHQSFAALNPGTSHHFSDLNRLREQGVILLEISRLAKRIQFPGVFRKDSLLKLHDLQRKCAEPEFVTQVDQGRVVFIRDRYFISLDSGQKLAEQIR